MNTKNNRTRKGFMLVDLIALSSTIMLVTSLAIPGLQQAREAARRSQCKNNLKMLGLALHNYHDVYLGFAPGWTAHHWNSGNGFRYGWMTSILPFMEYANMYDQLDFHKPNMADERFKTDIPSYHCPSDPSVKLNPLRGNLGLSNYAGNFGDTPPPRLISGAYSSHWPGSGKTFHQQYTGIFAANSITRMRDIVDGTSNTIMVAERSIRTGAGIWGGVRGNEFEYDVVVDGSPASKVNQTYGAMSSSHRKGFQVSFCDGSVRFISDEILSASEPITNPDQMETLQKLMNRQDGRPIGNEGF